MSVHVQADASYDSPEAARAAAETWAVYVRSVASSPAPRFLGFSSTLDALEPDATGATVHASLVVPLRQGRGLPGGVGGVVLGMSAGGWANAAAR